jgi:hypothetical protein
VDQEVANTLAALERKLGELELELTSIGRRDAQPQPQPQPQAPGVLVDEAAEQRYSMEARETVYGEIPATRDERQSIDLADLVRFRERMQHTLQELIDEYSRLLSLKPPTDA